MPATRLALLTLVLGLAIGAVLGFVFGDGPSRTVAASATTVDRGVVRFPAHGSTGDASGADGLASVAAPAAPRADSSALSDALDAAAKTTADGLSGRVAATLLTDEGPAGTERIAGTVVDVDGAPIEGVTVVTSASGSLKTTNVTGSSTSRVGRAWSGPRDIDESLEQSARSMLQSRRDNRTTVTDAAGRFEFEGLAPGRHRLNAYLEDYVFDSERVEPGDPATLVGRPVTLFRLDVRLPDGRTPESAVLQVGSDRRSDFLRWTPEEPVLRTKEPAINFKVLAGNVQSFGGRTHTSEFISEDVSLDLTTDGAGPHTIQLELRNVLRVTVEDTSNIEGRVQPWVKILDTALAEGRDAKSVLSEADNLARGDGSVFAKSDLTPGSYVLAVGRGATEAEVTETIEVTAGVTEHRVALGEVDMSRFLVVECKGPSGRPVANVRFQRRIERETGNTSTGGTSSIERGPGLYWLPIDRLVGEDDWTAGTKLTLTATATDYGEVVTPIQRDQRSVDIAFQATCTLMVRVEGDLSTGFSVSAARIDENEGQPQMRFYGYGGGGDSKRVDAEGNARITGLQPGRVRVSLKRSGDRGRWGPALETQEITVHTGEQVVTFLAPTFHDLVVHAPDLAPGEDLYLMRKQGESGELMYGGSSAKIAEDHRATFKEIASGTYTIQSSGGSGDRMEVTVPTGDVLFQPEVLNAFSVTVVKAGKLGAQAGLQRGDVVHAVNGKKFKGNSFHQRLFLEMESEAAALSIERGGAMMELSIGPSTSGNNAWGELGVQGQPVSR